MALQKTGSLPIIQNCWVVDDLEAAIDGWLGIGVGPFYTFDVDVPDAVYRGRPVPLRFTVACAQAEAIQIELIKQHSDGPSAYRDSVPAGQSGFHHVCRSFGDYDATVAHLARGGVQLATEGEIGGTRFCYADTRATIGCMLEVVDESDGGAALNRLIRDGALDWDGSDPVRRVDFAKLLGLTGPSAP